MSTKFPARRSARFATVALAITASTALLAGCAGGDGGGASDDGAGATGDFDWERYDGATIEVLLNQHPWQQAIEPRIAEFEDLTGITVNVTALPEEQFRQRVQVNLSARSDDLDVFMTGPTAEGRLFQQNGWYADLSEFIDNPSLTSEDYDYDDFSADVLAADTIDDEVIGVPIQIETTMLYYRTDVFKALGLTPPTTLDELQSSAEAITAAGELYGFTGRGKGASATSQFTPFLYNEGAQWNTEDGEAAFDTAEGIDAFTYYGDLVRENGPEGAVNNSWQEILPLFQQGRVAMFPDSSVFAPQLLDPEQSTVSENVGFLPVPSGPGGDTQAFYGWDLALSNFSENQGASWLFMQWATSPEVVQATQAEDGVAGARTSITEFPDTLPQEWIDAFDSSRQNAVAQHPTIAQVPEARDAIGAAIVTAIQGGDVAAAVETAAEAFNALSAR
ncbi:ABC transporter substrate-binding protein [Herbiconiux sp. L3-i23]|uniref:ABC transporter substrate-binding protein n=1 Tax=Herbiconiux sp. L3-i23 TaxID=2905871 RepID=UPI002069526A|nr:sugar ABC transporter substrate-binding protein [Herbiconiux sp. L3-i23]BDI22566.1 ABC transporter substrate-binding protein [Herbiconiux sp. L3-i23]